MCNPFEDEQYEINYQLIISEQVLDIKVGKSKKVTFAPKDIRSFRMGLSKIAIKHGMKFRTKRSSTGCLWVKRTR